MYHPNVTSLKKITHTLLHQLNKEILKILHRTKIKDKIKHSVKPFGQLFAQPTLFAKIMCKIFQIVVYKSYIKKSTYTYYVIN